MTVKCETMAELAYMIANAVQQGLTFEAHTSDLTITYTGGY